MIKKVIFLFLFAHSLHGASLRLQNESSCPLRAIIQGADGSILQEVEVPAQKTIFWEDSPAACKKGIVAANPKKSQTPLTVLWVCADGDHFGICDQISTGALVSSKQSSGKKLCPSLKEVKNE